MSQRDGGTLTSSNRVPVPVGRPKYGLLRSGRDATILDITSMDRSACTCIIGVARPNSGAERAEHTSSSPLNAK